MIIIADASVLLKGELYLILYMPDWLSLVRAL
jgi:hypothetical protein